MSEYIVKVGFWLLSYDTQKVTADSDTQAIESAKSVAHEIMERSATPDHIETSERCGGVIAYIDRITPDGQVSIIENLDFEDPQPKNMASTFSKSHSRIIHSNAITPDALDRLVDDATHAVKNVIPVSVRSGLTQAEQSKLLAEINDALNPVLKQWFKWPV